MAILIRKATKSDLPILIAFSTKLYIVLHSYDETINTDIAMKNDSRYITEQLDDPSCFYAIAEENGIQIGYMLCILRNNSPFRSILRAELEELFITDNARGKGVGTLLVNAFKSWSKTMHAKSMIVEALTSNTQAVSLYERLGFISLNIRLEQKVQ